MGSRTVKFHTAAIEEAQAARQWYAERSVAAAEAFMAELDAAIDRVSSSPEICPPHLHGTRRYLFKRFPFLLIFREKDDHILVVAVAHGRRRPAYWKERMDSPG